MKTKLWWVLLSVVLLLPVVSLILNPLRRQPATVQKPAASSELNLPLPEFQMTDQEGRAFKRTQLNGKVWIANFIFTSCAGICPEMTQKMAQLQKTLPAEIEFVSFSVDPARDTPRVLKQYGKQWGADFKRWHFLTGPEAAIRWVAQEGFRLSYAEGTDPNEPVIHSVRFVLVDKTGVIRGYYDSSDQTKLIQLKTDAVALLAAGR
jgi:protein SCO1/2